jgi:hypothetical protein
MKSADQIFNETDHEDIQAGRVVNALNAAFYADPEAIHAMMCNRVPCNIRLAEDKFIIVDESMFDGGHTVGLLGIINGILAAAHIPRVAMDWSDPDPEKDGKRRLCGFIRYTDRESTNG